MADNHGAPAPAGPHGPNGNTGTGKSEEDRREDVRQALRAKDPEEEVEEALGSRPEPPAEDDRKSAEEQPGEPPD